VTLEIEAEGPLLRIALARPDRRNAFDWEMMRGVATALADADADPAIRCIQILGRGGNFCAGRDLDLAPPADYAELLAHEDLWNAMFERLSALTKPCVAVVEGYAVGGGFTLAMGCHFVLARGDARFGAVEMRGGFPAAVNIAVLTHLVGRRQALALLMLPDLVTGEELHRQGLVNWLAGEGELERKAAEIAARLARLDPHAVKLTLETAKASLAMPYDEALTLGKHLNTMMVAAGRLTEGGRRHHQRGDGRKDG